MVLFSFQALELIHRESKEALILVTGHHDCVFNLDQIKVMLQLIKVGQLREG